MAGVAGAVLALAAALGVAAPGAAATDVPARGQLIGRVECRLAAGRAYALYVPLGEAPQRGWPILYAFDSHGAGAGFAGLFLPAAERLGWVVASAHGSSNVVPMEENVQLARAIWTDAHNRLALDDRRAYAAGFSGLSRFVTTLGFTAPGSLAGVIGLNGGFPLGQSPSKTTPFDFFATIGDQDFAYYELLDLEAKLAAAGVAHRLEIFPGSHEWPPAAVAGRSLEWMELRAMRAGLRPVDAVLVAALWSEGTARARAEEDEGRPWLAYRVWRSLSDDFAGLIDTTTAVKAVQRHEGDSSFQKDRAARAARDRRDRAYLERAPQILAAVPRDRGPRGVTEVLERLEVFDLQRLAAGDVATEEKLSAERRLYAVYIQTALYLPRLLSEHGQYDRVLFYLDVAGAIRPEVPHVHYRKAVAQARLGNARGAFTSLRRAVELGWEDRAAAEAEEAFESLRRAAEFRELVARMKAPAD